MKATCIAQVLWMCAAVAVLPGFPIRTSAQSANDIARVESLLRTDKITYTKTNSPSVWMIHSKGANLLDIKEIVAVGGGTGDDATLVVFVTLAEKKNMPVTTDFMRTLLEQNHKMDRVKIGFDNDGDLEVRIDSMLRVTDAKEFQWIVNQVMNASDQLYGTIENQLTR